MVERDSRIHNPLEKFSPTTGPSLEAGLPGYLGTEIRMCFVLGTLTQVWLLSQIKRTNCVISFQEKASNKSSASNCDLTENFAFLCSILGIMFWAPGISVSLTAGRLPQAAFLTAALVLGAFLSSNSAETWCTLYLRAGVSRAPGHSAYSSLSL